MLADKQLKGLDTKNYKSDFTLGNGKTIYFTNGVGRTIYTFSLDSFNINKFTKADLSNNNVFLYTNKQMLLFRLSWIKPYLEILSLPVNNN